MTRSKIAKKLVFKNFQNILKKTQQKIMNNENFPHAFLDCFGPESKIFITMALSHGNENHT